MKITIASSPKQLAVDDARTATFNPLVAMGIVNPFGPTLTAIGLDQPFKPNINANLLRLSLNPFSQSLQRVGNVEMEDNWNPLSDATTILPLYDGDCPTLVLAPTIFENEVAIAIYARLFKRLPNAADLHERLKRHPGNPWDRITEEVNGMTESIATPVTRNAPSVNLMSEASAFAMARHLLEEKNQREELRAFFFAWNGAIENAGASLASMPIKVLAEYIAVLSFSCHLPSLNRTS